MKYLIGGLVAVIVVLAGVFVVISKDTGATLYDDAPHVNYADISDTDGKNIYYFYQETCVHCNNIKDQIASFYYNKPEDIDFYLVDAADSANSDVWYQGSEEFVQPSGEFTSYEDIKIQGTPTMIEIDDGQFTEFFVGETDIPAYLEGLNA